MEDQEISLRLYESTLEVYKFAFKMAFQIVGGYFTGTALLFGFWLAHPAQKILLLLPALAGLGITIAFAVVAYYATNFGEWFSGPLNKLSHCVEHKEYSYFFPATEAIVYTIACFALTTLASSIGCIALFVGWLKI